MAPSEKRNPVSENADAKRRSRILVVDDHPNIRNDLKLILASQGYDVEIAASLKEMRMQLNRLLFDLVVLDIRLDEMKAIVQDQEEADKQQLRESLMEINKYGDETAVVVITGYATTELVFDIAAEYKELIAGFLDKPLKLDKVLERLRDGLDRTQQLRSQHITNNPMRNPSVILKRYFEPFLGKLPEPFWTILRELLYQDFFPLAPKVIKETISPMELKVLCWSRGLNLAVFVEVGEQQRVGKLTEFSFKSGSWQLRLHSRHPFGSFMGMLYIVENLPFPDFWSLSGDTR